MKISTEFGTLLQEVISPDTGGQASIRTGVSRGYWSDLLKGKVPRPEALERIIEGYRDRITEDQIKRLYEFAGYDIPAKWIEAESPKSPEQKLTEALEEVLFRDNHGKYSDHTKDLLSKAFDKINAIERSKETKGKE